MNTHIYNILHIYVYPTNKLLIMLINLNPHLRGRGTIWYSQLWMAISPKVPMYKNSETLCIPSPKYCLYTYVFKFMKQ